MTRLTCKAHTLWSDQDGRSNAPTIFLILVVVIILVTILAHFIREYFTGLLS